MTPFPTEGPFRIDQVTAAPLLMAGLFGCQLAAAAWMSWAGIQGRRYGWWIGAGILLSLVALFFTLASWGTSDTTKLSHFLPHDLALVQGEPFWQASAPLVGLLPYRMAAVHGLVAAGYAAAPILLAWRWRALAWGGWWSLLIFCSPVLRGFLQNAHTRQALALLLLLPLMLWAGRLVDLRRPVIAVGVLWSVLVHSTFPSNLLLSLSPLLLRDRATGTTTISRWQWLLTLGALAALLIAVAPIAWQKIALYAARESFFSHYSVLREVQRLQWALALGLALTCWRRHLGAMQLLRCSLSRQLALFSVLFLLIQASVEWEWFPQITFRLADGVGFFLLITYLAWIHRYQAYAFLLPALLVTLHYWLFGRILNTETLACGANDSFLCIPDRWPWQVRY